MAIYAHNSIKKKIDSCTTTTSTTTMTPSVISEYVFMCGFIHIRRSKSARHWARARYCLFTFLWALLLFELHFSDTAIDTYIVFRLQSCGQIHFNTRPLLAMNGTRVCFFFFLFIQFREQWKYPKCHNKCIDMTRRGMWDHLLYRNSETYFKCSTFSLLRVVSVVTT